MAPNKSLCWDRPYIATDPRLTNSFIDFAPPQLCILGAWISQLPPPCPTYGLVAGFYYSVPLWDNGALWISKTPCTFEGACFCIAAGLTARQEGVITSIMQVGKLRFREITERREQLAVFQLLHGPGHSILILFIDLRHRHNV